MRRRSSGFSVISVLAAASLWGTSGPAQALAHTGASPAAIGAARLLLGGLALAAVSLASGSRPRSWLCGAEWRWLVVAAASTAVFQASFFSAVNRTGAGLATLVALGAAPAATGICARFVQGEQLTSGWLLATATAVGGCVLLLLPASSGSADPLGIAFALLAAACYGGYTVAAKRLLQAERPVEGVIAASLLGGALVLAPAFADRAAELAGMRGIALIVWLALASTALAYVLFVRGLHGVPAATAGTLSLAEPLVAVALAVLVLDERLHAFAIAGALLLLAGVALASLPTLRRPAASETLLDAPSW